MKYDAKELAEMAIRNYQEATKTCGGKPCATDPTECVAKVFAVPLDTLERVEQENAMLRKEIEFKRFALESVLANNGDLSAARDALMAALPGHPHLN